MTKRCSRALATSLLGSVVALAAPGLTFSDSDYPTFAEEIAPIIYENCAPCHRPGGAGPFSLTTYQEVRRRSRQIVDVTRSGFMPPWLPEAGHGDFADERRLSPDEIALIQSWVKGGSLLGESRALPPAPQWSTGWQLGEPDLVIRMEQPYTLAASGPDVFRNFVIPIPVDSTRYVRTVELRPGNPRIVHHAVMRTDETLSSRLQAASDPETGFASMNMGDSKQPDGYLLAWTPGNLPDPGREGYAWTLRPGSDLVLQLHMQPSGKPEPIQAMIGFYFAESPPTHHVADIMLRARNIDIPAGESAYTTEDSYTLPVDVEAISIYPHAHYLGKQFDCWAELPDGSREWLIKIDDWDFNWQDEYDYARPVELPAGTRIYLRIVYDNSANNIRNPFSPPQRVRGGLSSVDEMGTLTLQVVPRSEAERDVLREALVRQDLEKDSDDWLAHFNLASAAQSAGRYEEAILHYGETLRLNPTRTRAHNNLGLALLMTGEVEAAEQQILRALELNPAFADAHFTLGLLLQQNGDDVAAEREYRLAIELNQNLGAAHFNLARLYQERSRLDQADSHFQAALRLMPDDAEIYNNLGNLRFAQRRPAEAARYYRKAVELAPDLSEAHYNLANSLYLLGDLDRAVEHYGRAVAIDPELEDARHNLAEVRSQVRERDTAIAEARSRVEASGGLDVGALMTLADLQAGYGRVDRAIETANRALALVSEAGRRDVAERIKERIRLYRESRPPGSLPD